MLLLDDSNASLLVQVPSAFFRLNGMNCLQVFRTSSFVFSAPRVNIMVLLPPVNGKGHVSGVRWILRHGVRISSEMILYCKMEMDSMESSGQR